MDDYYDIVGVEPTAPPEVIDNAIRAQLRVWRPRTASADLERRHRAERRVQQLTEARSVLLDEEQRRRYDQVGPGQPQPTDQPTDDIQPADIAANGDPAAAARRRRFGQLPAPIAPSDWDESAGTDSPLDPPGDPLGTSYVG